MRDSRGLNIIRAGLLGLALALVASTLSGCGPCCCRGSWSTAVQDQWSDKGVRLEDPTELVSLARQLKLRRKTLTTTLHTTTELLTTTTPSTSPAAAPGTTSAAAASTELPTTASGSRWSSGILNQAWPKEVPQGTAVNPMVRDTPRPGDNQECRIEDGEYSAVLRKSLVNARGCFRATLQLQCGPMGTRSVSLKIMRRETFWKAAFRTMYVRQIRCPAFFDALDILASTKEEGIRRMCEEAPQRS
ncbi:hypothetical protein FOZ60_011804 [Perkinsus olseni]|uniref:Uncharacterized protein n=1 Tax=Perkinsus olseni TaxID=32597 RepID=A0A7J6PM27_PEROL|nr:hypothetical protein FOZ60_011804 [Perkinsus olseni]